MSVGADGFRLPSINEVDTKNKIETLPGEISEYCKTFVIYNEDHTIGNALKHIIIQNPDVELCGYTIPHPMERKIHLRIQSVNKPATEILRESLEELKSQNETVLKLIKKQVKTYKEENAT